MIRAPEDTRDIALGCPFQVPGISGRRPWIVVDQDLGQLAKRALHCPGVKPDTVKPHIRVVGGGLGGGVSDSQTAEVRVHSQRIVDLIDHQVNAFTVPLQAAGGRSVVACWLR